MRVGVATLLATHLLSAGCREPSSDEEARASDGCGYEDREVSLDAKFGEVTPRDVIELFEQRPVDGHVKWYGGEGPYIDVGGASGETEFHAQVSFLGPVWVQEGIEGMGGVLEERIFCGTVLFFDVAVEVETADGALADTWIGRAEYGVSGPLGPFDSIRIEVPDPRPFAGSLTVTERPEVPAQWATRDISIYMAFVTSPPDMLEMRGSIRYHLMNSGQGQAEGGTVNEVQGVTVSIAEFSRVE